MVDIYYLTLGRRGAATYRILGAGAGAALLLVSWATGVLAQDRANTTNFINSAPYTGDVLSNTGTIDNTSAAAHWTGSILTNDRLIRNNLNATWEGDVLSNLGQYYYGDGIENRGIWLGNVAGNGDPADPYPAAVGSYGYIMNGVTGTWTGDVTGNSDLIFNEGGHWAGDIVNNAGAIWNASGNAGYDPGIGYWVGDILANTGEVLNTATGDWQGDVYGNSYLVKNNGAWQGHVIGNSRSVSNFGTWVGEVRANGYRVSNWNGAHWMGNVLGNSDKIYNRTEVGQPVAWWSGDIIGNNGIIDNEARSRWTGDVVNNPGTILNGLGSLWEGNVRANAGTIQNTGTWNGSAQSNAGTINTASIWNGSITSSGIVNASSTVNGAVTNSGILNVTGALVGITTLNSSGTLNLVGNGATQTLSVGTLILASTARYGVDVTAIGGSDLMTVTGAATLAGTVHVAASTTGGGTFDAQKSYTILSAGSISGSFAGVSTDLAFLAPQLSYDAGNVYLALRRNDVGFATTGTTGNQASVGASVEALGAGNPIYDAVLWLTPAQAQNAFDQLSGEAFGSSGNAAVQSANVVGGAGALAAQPGRLGAGR